jgi:hypothetical protein
LCMRTVCTKRAFEKKGHRRVHRITEMMVQSVWPRSSTTLAQARRLGVVLEGVEVQPGEKRIMTSGGCRHAGAPKKQNKCFKLGSGCEAGRVRKWRVGPCGPKRLQKRIPSSSEPIKWHQFQPLLRHFLRSWRGAFSLFFCKAFLLAPGRLLWPWAAKTKPKDLPKCSQNR